MVCFENAGFLKDVHCAYQHRFARWADVSQPLQLEAGFTGQPHALHHVAHKIDETRSLRAS